MAELTKKHVLGILQMIASEYGDKLDVATTQMRVEMWFASLNAYPEELVGRAVANAMRSTPYRLKLADVCNAIKSMQALGEKSDETLWEELRAVFPTVVHNTEGYRYDYMNEGARCRKSNEAIFSALSPEIRSYLRSVSELITVAYMNEEALRFEKTRFFRRIGEIREQERLRKETPKEILQLFGSAVPQITEGK